MRMRAFFMVLELALGLCISDHIVISSIIAHDYEYSCTQNDDIHTV